MYDVKLTEGEIIEHLKTSDLKVLKKNKEVKVKVAKAKEVAKLKQANGEPTTEKQMPAIVRKKRKVKTNFKLNKKGD